MDSKVGEFMNRRSFGLGLVSATAAFLSGCGSKFKKYNGPEVTSIVINKGERRMYLLHNSDVLKEYRVDLGFAPVGDKKIKGDGKTPEGTYYINRKNPNSQFHLSLGISYPNNADRAEAKAVGKEPGGDIFIHGQAKPKKSNRDWTAGCIAVKNRQIEDIYAMVNKGTTVTLRP